MPGTKHFLSFPSKCPTESRGQAKLPLADNREWMGPGGLRGLQIRWRAPFGVRGGFDSLALPPTPRTRHSDLYDV